jgi:integrating conjugative element protein (TIGR03752 family)
MGSSKLLPMVAIIVLFGLVFIGVKTLKSDQPQTISLPGVPAAPPPDQDSPADTIRTLTAKVADISRQSKALVDQNSELLKQRRETDARVKRQVKEALQKEYAAQQDNPAVNQLSDRFTQLQSQLESYMAVNEKDDASDIPLGLGLDHLSGVNPETLHWVDPLGTTQDKQGNAVYPATNTSQTPITNADTGGLLHTSLTSTQSSLRKTPPPTLAEETPLEPYYTVPRNATLVGSTGMTALIGRIPTQGQVQDPFPFKVIVGADNLAANGIEIPGVDGMIFSGTATGDWALSCVRGTLHSVTFVFTDGTIRTVSSDDNSLQQLNRSQGGNANTTFNDRPLGWISDRRGIPCVSGTRISNAIDYLAGRMLARAVEAGGQAFSQGEVTNQTSGALGVTTSIITGDAAKFAGLNALSGSANELSEYLRERAAQSFDVVFVDTGVELAIHIDIELPIDYDPNGRQTTYAFRNHEIHHALD